MLYQDTEAYLERTGTVLVQTGGPALSTSWTNRVAAVPSVAREEQEVRADGPLTASSDVRDTWTAGRSVYWGVVAYFAVLLFGSWGVVALNALCCGTAISILWFRSLQQVSAPRLYLVLAPLVFLTPLGIFTAMMMPDLMAGILIICMAALGATWNRLRRFDRIVCVALAAFAAMSHDSLLLVGLAIGFVAALVAIRQASAGRERVAWNLTALAIPAAAGIAGTLLFTVVTVEVTGQRPLRFPFLTAHLTDLDFGKRHLREACPEANYAICDSAHKLPIDWTAFMFDPSPDTGIYAPAPPAVKRELSDEQYRFAINAVAERPLAAITQLSWEAVRQLTSFDLGDIQQYAKRDFFSRYFPANVVASAEETRIWRDPELLRHFHTASKVTATAAVLILLALSAGAVFGTVRLPAGSLELLLILLAGLVINAAVCGMLASPLGRFQARVIWILPLVAGLLLATTGRWLPNSKDKSHGTI